MGRADMRIDDVFAVELERDGDDPKAPTTLKDPVSVDLLEGGALHVVSKREYLVDGYQTFDSVIYPARRVRKIELKMYTLAVLSGGHRKSHYVGLSAAEVREKILYFLGNDGVDPGRAGRFVDHLLARGDQDHFEYDMSGKHDYRFIVYS
ncbi:hypothetical protein [Mycobacteroides abscessus]|uniref:hypothetical protein n=1 Tax=Mycobacteroides abscessus TaxID=36809 RepID=UPI00104260ED|nr:hypothetical protein [Mycobacteroides abscessus]MDO3327494.1 hypothetical protein [Mycobacteroides abscessus subsp. abscessus]